MTQPRIPPLPREEHDERVAELVASLRVHPDAPDMNLFDTLARHPRLLKRWSAFGGMLLFGGALPGRDRELLILRTAALTGADYEWAHHQELAHIVGLTDEEIARVVVGPDHEGWTAADSTLLSAADELHQDSCIGDATWAALVATYDEPQLIEIPMIVGQYHLVAFTLRSLGIEREAAYPNGIPT